MAKTSRNKKENETFVLLNSSKEEDILKGLKQAKEYGTEKMIPQIITIAIEGSNENIKKKGIDILYNLQDDHCIPVILSEVEKMSLSDSKQLVLASLWHSNLNTNAYIIELVQMALKQDYLVCLECLTVIENMQGSLDNELLEKALLMINEHLQYSKDDKIDLIKELKLVIEQFLIG